MVLGFCFSLSAVYGRTCNGPISCGAVNSCRIIEMCHYQDVVVGRPRDENDRVKWLLQHQKFTKALSVARAFRKSDKETWEQVSIPNPRLLGRENNWRLLEVSLRCFIQGSTRCSLSEVHGNCTSYAKYCADSEFSGFYTWIGSGYLHEKPLQE